MDDSDSRAALASAIDSLRATLRRTEKRLPPETVTRFYADAIDALALVNVRALQALVDDRVAALPPETDEGVWT